MSTPPDAEPDLPAPQPTGRTLWWPGVVTAAGMLVAAALTALASTLPLVAPPEIPPIQFTARVDEPGLATGEITGSGFGGASGEFYLGLGPSESLLWLNLGTLLALAAGLVAVFAVLRTSRAAIIATRVATALGFGVLAPASLGVAQPVHGLDDPLFSTSPGLGAVLLIVASVVAFVAMVLSWFPHRMPKKDDQR
ncbi:hypothetical protein JOD54_005889 [Actinokineospora baliensis]|uniref:hypothetical protein n=1 Tax=Actinokineospora baliensis TaxID=547056 RepID=UPI00195E1468|nr:hypothetical protein [Actinokineospora baliensis]MBM7775685.1 hypothetical protein [Actinokineospora baliensis]